jgi:hypothetical protein
MEWIWQYGGNVVPKEISDIPFHSVVVSKKVFSISIHTTVPVESGDIVFSHCMRCLEGPTTGK